MQDTVTLTLPQLAAKLGISVREMETRLMAVGWSHMMNEAERHAAGEAWDQGPKAIERRVMLDHPPHERHLLAAARDVLGLEYNASVSK